MKTILITGASSSIGRPLAQHLLKHGFTVLAHFRNCHDDLLTLKAKYEELLYLMPADFEDNVDLNNLIRNLASFPPLFAIIHLPSQKISLKPLARIQWTEYETHMNIQLRSLQKIVQATITSMKKSGSGYVISISTDAIFGNDIPKGFTPYAVAKSALRGFMKSLDAEYRDTGVKVHQIIPKMFKSPLLEEIPNYVVEQTLSQQDIIETGSYQLRITTLISDLLTKSLITDHEIRI